MRAAPLGQFGQAPKEYDPEWFDRALFQIERLYVKINTVLDGAVGFGDGVDIDNLIGKWIDYVSNAVPGTEDTIAHNLGMIPIGFILMIPPESGVINRGSTPWTTSSIYLRCTAASQTARLFLVVSSQGLLT